MRKLLLYFLTILSFLSFVPTAFGQAALTERWVCLKAEKPKSGKGDAAFRQYLSVEPEQRPIPLTDTFIIECLATDAGQICTTGIPALDMVVYKKNNVTEIQKKTEFTYVGLFKPDGETTAPNPIMTDATGDFGGLEWESRSGHTPRKFMAMNYWDPTKPVAGSVGGQQQGTFGFAQADKKCVLIQWDPYGRVFDSQTLEPILGARVTLLFEKNGTFTPMTPSDLLSGNITNPQTTKEDGQFSFVVPDGNYKLSVVPAPVEKNYKSPVLSESVIHPNSIKAYDNLYPVQTGEIISQRGGIQHRDVPVVTANTTRQPKLMNYFYEAYPNGKLLIQGTTSHPLTKIVAKTAKVYANNPSVRLSYRQIATTQTDKWGRFSLEIDQKKLEKTKEYIELFQSITLVKTDLRLISRISNKLVELARLFVPDVQAQAGLGELTIPFEPIPQYLEGYVYDQNNLPIPDATVEIIEQFSNNPHSTVKADKTGYIKITSEYLPKSRYDMKVLSQTGASFTLVPSDFVSKNILFIADKKIDVYSYKDKDNQTYQEIQKKALTSVKRAQEQLNLNPLKEQETVSFVNKNTLPLIFALVLLIIVFITVLVIFVVERKKSL